MTDIGTEIDIMEGIFMIEGDTLLITEQCFQPQHSINHPGYPVYHTNYQYCCVAPLWLSSLNPFIELRIRNNSLSSDMLYIQASISISPKYESKSKTNKSLSFTVAY